MFETNICLFNDLNYGHLLIKLIHNTRVIGIARDDVLPLFIWELFVKNESTQNGLLQTYLKYFVL